MAVTYGFYNGKDRLYDARQISRTFEGVLFDGVVACIGDLFTCVSIDGNNISIGSGFGYFKGFYVYNDKSYTYNIPDNLFENYNYKVTSIEISEIPQTEYPSGNNLDLGNISVIAIGDEIYANGQCYMVIELNEIDRVFEIKAIKISDFNSNIHIPIAIIYKDTSNFTRVQNLVGYSGKWRVPCDNGDFSGFDIVGPCLIHGPIAKYHINNIYDIIHDNFYELYCSYFDPNKSGSKTNEFNNLLERWGIVLHHHDTGLSQYEKFIDLLDSRENKPTIIPVTLEANSTSKTINYVVPDNKIITINSQSVISINNIRITNNSIYLSYDRLNKSCKINIIIHENSNEFGE